MNLTTQSTGNTASDNNVSGDEHAASKVTLPATTKSSVSGEEEILYQELKNFYAKYMSKDQVEEVVGNIKKSYASLTQEQRLKYLKILVQQIK
jgi:hypothetical protein